VRSAYDARDSRFKLRYDRPLGKKLRPKHRHHGGNVVFRDGLSTVGDHADILGVIVIEVDGMDAKGFECK
jgi:hypothetical protein